MSPFPLSIPCSAGYRGAPRARDTRGVGPARRASRLRYRHQQLPSGWLGRRRVGHDRRVVADSFFSQEQSTVTSVESQAPGFDYEKVWYPAMPVRERWVEIGRTLKGSSDTLTHNA